MGTLKNLPLYFLIILLAISCSEDKMSSKGEEKEVWRFALEEIEGSVQDAYAKKFKELIEARTDDKVQVKIYPYGALGTSDQITELVENGALHFAMASPGFIGKIIPEVEVFLLHFLFPKKQQVLRKTLHPESPVISVFKPIYREKGFELLDINAEGWMAWTANKKLLTPNDFEGLKIRVMTTPLLLSSYEAYGANPTPMAYSEVYSALQLKMIDAQVNPIFAIEEMSFYEVSDYMILTYHAPFISSVVANDNFYDSLTTDRKQLVDDVVQELSDYILDFQTQYNQERMKTIRTKKPSLQVLKLTQPQRETFKSISEEIRKDYLEQHGEAGQRILDTIQSTIEENQL